MQFISFILLLVTYLVILWSKVTGNYFPQFINGYLSDLICIPLVLTICTWIIRWVKNDRSIIITKPMVITVVIIFSVGFEFLLPKLYDNHTSDLIDIVCYILGGITFYQLQQHKVWV